MCAEYDKSYKEDNAIKDESVGDNFDRPVFNKMINDIESGKINCVITKDTTTLKDIYKEGMRIELISMGEDTLYNNKGEQYENPNKVPPGTLGTVTHVDSMGTIHVRWDNGSGLGLIPGEDNFKIIPDSSLNRQLEEPEMEIN